MVCLGFVHKGVPCSLTMCVNEYIYSALQYGCTVSSPYLHNKHTNISIHAKQPAWGAPATDTTIGEVLITLPWDGTNQNWKPEAQSLENLLWLRNTASGRAQNPMYPSQNLRKITTAQMKWIWREVSNSVLNGLMLQLCKFRTGHNYTTLRYTRIVKKLSCKHQNTSFC